MVVWVELCPSSPQKTVVLIPRSHWSTVGLESDRTGALLRGDTQRGHEGPPGAGRGKDHPPLEPLGWGLGMQPRPTLDLRLPASRLWENKSVLLSPWFVVFCYGSHGKLVQTP